MYLLVAYPNEFFSLFFDLCIYISLSYLRRVAPSTLSQDNGIDDYCRKDGECLIKEILFKLVSPKTL